MFVLFKSLWTNSFSYFFSHLGCKTRILIQKWLIVLVATSDNLICNLACASVDRSISSSKKSLCIIDLQVVEFSSCASLCVCLPLENDSAVFVIHHSVFVSCHSLDLFFSLECYSSLLNLWLVLRHGVFSGTTSMLTVASAFWESLCVFNNACVCVCERERVWVFEWLHFWKLGCTIDCSEI